MLVNRKCNFCGNEYYICRNCIKIGNAWKNVCCSRECFIEMSKTQDIVKPIKLNEEATMKKILLRGKLCNGYTVDVIGYDLDLGRFDCTNGKTYTFKDFECMYLSGENLEDIIKTVKYQTETRVKALTKNTRKKVQTPETQVASAVNSNTLISKETVLHAEGVPSTVKPVISAELDTNK